MLVPHFAQNTDEDPVLSQATESQIRSELDKRDRAYKLAKIPPMRDPPEFIEITTFIQERMEDLVFDKCPRRSDAEIVSRLFLAVYDRAGYEMYNSGRYYD